MQLRECVVGSLHAEFNSVNFFCNDFYTVNSRRVLELSCFCGKGIVTDYNNPQTDRI